MKNCDNCNRWSGSLARINEADQPAIFWCFTCIENSLPDFFENRRKQNEAKKKENPCGFNDARMVDVNRRAVQMLRYYRIASLSTYKEDAAQDCRERIKKAYTAWYKDFWKAVLHVIEEHKPVN